MVMCYLTYPWPEKRAKMSFPGGELRVAAQRRLIDVVLPRGGYVIALAEAYFDDSGTHDDSQAMIVAGYVFTQEKAKALAPKWQALLDEYELPYFHMKEVAHLSGIAKYLCRKCSAQAAQQAIELVKEHAERGIALSLERSAFSRVVDDVIFRNPYAFLCSQVFYAVKEWAIETGFDGRVSYFFESGTKGWGEADAAMDLLYANHPENKADVRHFSHAKLNKEDSSALQCADMLAWHMYGYVRKRAEGNRVKRKDFANLLGVPTAWHHYDAESMDNWLLAWDTCMRSLATAGRMTVAFPEPPPLFPRNSVHRAVKALA